MTDEAADYTGARKQEQRSFGSLPDSAFSSGLIVSRGVSTAPPEIF